MDDDLPTEFDVIVIGTGMTESIVAAAASRIGKRVLHLDTSDYYGGMWASFNFEGLLKLIQDTRTDKAVPNDTANRFNIFNVDTEWFIQDIPEEIVVDASPAIKLPEISSDVKMDNPKEVTSVTGKESEGDSVAKPGNVEKSSPTPVKEEIKAEAKTQDIVWTQNKVKKEYRKFNIDLAPKLLFARGELVELLISSNIARYAEFRCVNRVLTWLNGCLEPVPCSRSDVFATKHVTVVEKRMLMKLLTSFMNYDANKPNEFQGFENKTFLDFLKSKRLTGNLIHYVLYAIAGGTDCTPCLEGIQRCNRFLTSLGRYGNTPFLWSMYGCGELPQCFCRLCAVFGGVYCLKRPIDEIKVSESEEDPLKSVTIKSKDKLLTCEHVVIGIDKVPNEFLPKSNSTKGISRAVFVTNKSILEFEKESLTLLQFPPLQGRSDPVKVIELGPSTSSSPNGLYILHMTCLQHDSAKEDLHSYAEKLLSLEQCDTITSHVLHTDPKVALSKTKPQVLWSFYFNMLNTSDAEICKSSSPRVHLCSGPDLDLDFDHAVKQGKEIFERFCKDSEFLPRAPDPEEIIFEGNDSEVGPVFETEENKTSESENVTQQEQSKYNVMPEEQSKENVMPQEQSKDNVMPEEPSKDNVMPQEQSKDHVMPQEQSKENFKPQEQSKDNVTSHKQSEDNVMPKEQSEENVRPQEQSEENETVDKPDVPMEDNVVPELSLP